MASRTTIKINGKTYAASSKGSDSATKAVAKLPKKKREPGLFGGAISKIAQRLRSDRMATESTAAGQKESGWARWRERHGKEAVARHWAKWRKQHGGQNG